MSHITCKCIGGVLYLIMWSTIKTHINWRVFSNAARCQIDGQKVCAYGVSLSFWNIEIFPTFFHLFLIICLWYISCCMRARIIMYYRGSKTENYMHLITSCLYIGKPANPRRWSNAGLMLGQRRRRWTNIKPALDQRLLLAGKLH